MVSGTKRYKQHHQAVCTELDGDVALFQSNTCDYLVLNETGSAIWNALKTQPTLPELCKNLDRRNMKSLQMNASLRYRNLAGSCLGEESDCRG